MAYQVSSKIKSAPIQKWLSVKNFLVLLAIFGLVAYSIPSTRAAFIKLLSFSACDTPIPYALGILDTRFNLSESQATQDIQKATEIWSSFYGKPLFTYSPTAKLKIHFVYDKRTALNTQINTQQSQLNQKNTLLQQQINTYEADVAAFEKKLASFNDRVEQANRAGGASDEQYNALIAEQNALKAESDALNVRASQLNMGARSFNANLQNLKENMNQFNAELAQKPEEGLYNPTEKTITIYFAENRDELVHTLAHEMGHALNMDHTGDKNDIMYQSSTQTLTLTPNDKKQLEYVCREQLLPVRWLQTYRAWILSIIRLASLLTT